MKWQPIETAPKDGTLVLIFCKDAKEPSLSRFKDGVWMNNHYGWREQIWHFSDVTHWMPLPETPNTKTP